MQKDGQSLLNSDVPMGLGMALAQNVEAMQAFSAMEPAKQRAIIDRTHTIGSKRKPFYASRFRRPQERGNDKHSPALVVMEMAGAAGGEIAFFSSIGTVRDTN